MPFAPVLGHWVQLRDEHVSWNKVGLLVEQVADWVQALLLVRLVILVVVFDWQESVDHSFLLLISTNDFFESLVHVQDAYLIFFVFFFRLTGFFLVLQDEDTLVLIFENFQDYLLLFG